MNPAGTRPVVATIAAVIKDHRILLIRRRNRSDAGRWVGTGIASKKHLAGGGRLGGAGMGSRRMLTVADRVEISTELEAAWSSRAIAAH